MEFYKILLRQNIRLIAIYGKDNTKQIVYIGDKSYMVHFYNDEVISIFEIYNSGENHISLLEDLNENSVLLCCIKGKKECRKIINKYH